LLFSALQCTTSLAGVVDRVIQLPALHEIQPPTFEQRLSALALAGSLVPTTLAGHSYWKIEDPELRKLQRIQFHKNMAMIGGLLFAALDQPAAQPAARD